MSGLGASGPIKIVVGCGCPDTGNVVRASGHVGLQVIGLIAHMGGFGLKAAGIEGPSGFWPVERNRTTINRSSRWVFHLSLIVIRM
jgi:hypothetical protein